MQVLALLKPETFSSACSLAHTPTLSLRFSSVPASDIIPTLFSAAGPLTASLPPSEQTHAAFAHIPLLLLLAKSLCIPLLPPLFLPSRLSGCCMFPVSPSLALPPPRSRSVSLSLSHFLSRIALTPFLVLSSSHSFSWLFPFLFRSLSLTYSLAGLVDSSQGFYFYFFKSNISSDYLCHSSNLWPDRVCFLLHKAQVELGFEKGLPLGGRIFLACSLSLRDWEHSFSARNKRKYYKWTCLHLVRVEQLK